MIIIFINKLGLGNYNIGMDETVLSISRLALGWHFDNLFSIASEFTNVRELYAYDSDYGLRHHQNFSLLGRYNYADYLNSFLPGRWVHPYPEGWLQPYLQLGFGISSYKKNINPSLTIGTGLHFWIYNFVGLHLQLAYKPVDSYVMNYGFGVSIGIGGSVDSKKKKKKLFVAQDISDEQISKKEKEIARLAEQIAFKTNSAKLTPESTRVLIKIARSVRGTKLQILIEGHTDNVGRADQNKKLSFDRAKAVRNYLRLIGLKNKIVYLGYGQQYPIETNATDKGRAINRRVEIKVAKNIKSVMRKKQQPPSTNPPVPTQQKKIPNK